MEFLKGTAVYGKLKIKETNLLVIKLDWQWQIKMHL